MLNDHVVAGWAASPVATRKTAAILASDLAMAPQNSRVESVRNISARFSVCGSVATNARNLLIGRGIIYKSGRHYYVA